MGLHVYPTLLCSSALIQAPLSLLLQSIQKLIKLPYVEVRQGGGIRLSHFNYIRERLSNPLSSPLCLATAPLPFDFLSWLYSLSLGILTIPSFHLPPYSTMFLVIYCHGDDVRLAFKINSYTPDYDTLKKIRSPNKKDLTSLNLPRLSFVSFLPFVSFVHFCPTGHHSHSFCISLSAVYINLITTAGGGEN